MSDDKLPHPVWSGSFTICGIEMKCHVLSDGQRIIEAESIEKFFSAFEDDNAGAIEAIDSMMPSLVRIFDYAEFEKLAHWTRGTA